MSSADLPKCGKTGKIIYTRSGAAAAAAAWRRKYYARMTSFSCKSCKGWHIGNNRLKPKNRRR